MHHFVSKSLLASGVVVVALFCVGVLSDSAFARPPGKGGRGFSSVGKVFQVVRGKKRQPNTARDKQSGPAQTKSSVSQSVSQSILKVKLL
jgi:hypothetical protein